MIPTSHARLQERRAARLQAQRRRRALAVLMLLAALVVGIVLSQPTRTSRPRTRAASKTSASRQTEGAAPVHFATRHLAITLPSPLQDSAAVALGSGRVALLGGLNAADTSTAAVSVLDARGLITSARLPEAQPDAQGAMLDGRAYVFGGGQVSSYSHILSYDPATGNTTQAGGLPTPTSDAAVAALAGTAYVVGGYDGQQALDTIIAWRPGGRPRLVGRLPYGVRYATVAASNGRLVVAGGSRGEAATTTILSFDPATGKVRHLGNLPDPTTHAAAIALGAYVYVFGGRGSASNTQSAAIVAIDPATGHAVRDGGLPQPLSDTAAVSLGDRVWLAGGLSASGPVASVLELTPNLP
jgi:hypothetical protein